MIQCTDQMIQQLGSNASSIINNIHDSNLVNMRTQSGGYQECLGASAQNALGLVPNLVDVNNFTVHANTCW